MSTPPTPGEVRQAAGKYRRPIWLTVAVVAVVAVIVVIIRLSGGSSDPAAVTSPSATSSTSASVTATPSPSRTVPKSSSATPRASKKPTASTPTNATVSPTPSNGTLASNVPTRAPVPIDDNAPFGDGVTAKIVSVKPVQSSGSGVGEIRAPAIKVTIRLTNGTSSELPLDAATVTTSYGAQSTPGIPIVNDPSAKPFAGSIKPGETVTGAYIFNVPKSQRSDVTVTLSHAPLSPVVVFEGSVR